MAIIDNKSEWNKKQMENFIHSNGALLQQTTMFQKIRKTTTQHHSKYKTGATLGGLLLWPGLGSHLEELSRRGLKIFGALAKRNWLKRLNEKNWHLGMGDRSITYGPYSLLGCIRVLTFVRLSRPKRIAFLGRLLGRSYCQSSSRAGSLDLFWSILDLEAGGGILPDGRGIVHALYLPQVGRGFNPSLLKSLDPNLGIVKPAYPRNLSL